MLIGLENVIIVAVVAVIVLLAALYIRREKKKGARCIGCPDSKTCPHRKTGCSEKK